MENNAIYEPRADDNYYIIGYPADDTHPRPYYLQWHGKVNSFTESKDDATRMTSKQIARKMERDNRPPAGMLIAYGKVGRIQ